MTLHPPKNIVAKKQKEVKTTFQLHSQPKEEFLQLI